MRTYSEDKLYAGIDLHRKYSYVTIMNKQGDIQEQKRFENSENMLVPALLSYGK
mgnify:CR=1 FL=1